MNKKIFTLLACVFVLFSTAFTANAIIIGGNLSTGDTVRALPDGASTGMYHIRIDSIYVGTSFSDVTPSNTGYIPAFGTGIDLQSLSFFDLGRDANGNSLYNEGDTLVLAVTDVGRIVPVSITHMRKESQINHIDLQSTLWCTEVQKAKDVKDGFLGQYPLFFFTNKVFNVSLDFNKDNYITPATDGKGWMYSINASKLNYSQPLFNRAKDDPETSEDESITTAYVLTATPKSSTQTTYIAATPALINNVVYRQDVELMLKFTIVEAAPFVLDADAFNTVFGNAPGGSEVKLTFDRNFSDNPFGKKLVASTAYNSGYLTIRTSDDNNLIYNLLEVPEATAKAAGGLYANTSSQKYIKLHNDGLQGKDNSEAGKGDKDYTKYNSDYRFVYFPSKDSLVINAYQVYHYNNEGVTDGIKYDPGEYIQDDLTSGNPPIYYGLYNETIHNHLIVRAQDLTGGNSQFIMTVANGPSNVHMSFGGLACVEALENLLDIKEGVYTIWDNRGRILGIRIYGGSLAPQWLELEEGECPDRIPAYQWVVERNGDLSQTRRVNITNREFGNLYFENEGRSLVRLENVKIYKDETRRIFAGQSQFLYPGLTGLTDYETITYGWVTGKVLGTKGVIDCTLKSESGFRPVPVEYTSDPHLGYKWFKVETDENSVNYGRSDNWVENGQPWLGMDHNAFSFNYLHNYSDKYYINHKSSYTDTVLHVGLGREAFRLMAGTAIRLNKYQEEAFGYPLRDTTYSSNPDQRIAGLSRYYYELKVADFYSYRDGLAEQYVVLKGANKDQLDIRNALMYGFVDTYRDKDPFEYTNIYLREAYFLPQDEKKTNEERDPRYPNERVYYAILDRIKAQQFPRLKEMGFEITDTLRPSGGPDQSSYYGLITWKVDDTDGFIRAHGKTGTAVRASTFALENNNYELYRRLNSVRDDGAVLKTGVDTLDAPKVLRIYQQLNKKKFFHEDALSKVSYNLKGINYLAVSNYSEDEVAADGLKKYNYNLFIDTAYINRGTGLIKPQYMIAVGVKVVADSTYQVREDNCCEMTYRDVVIPGYTYGRYLVNATDSARGLGSNGKTQIKNQDYIYNGTHDRLVFVPAIHDYKNDRLYILSEVHRQLGSLNDYTFLDNEGKLRYNIDVLKAYSDKGRLKERTLVQKLSDDSSPAAYYDFGHWENNHNDVTFSLRFVTNEAKNANPATGEDYVTNDLKQFYIESEAKDRTPYGNKKIGDVQGGWIQLNNDIPVLSRGQYEDAIGQSDVFNVEKPTPENSTPESAVLNDKVSTVGIEVIAGTGEISILNASSKNVTVSNLLGQTIAKTVLSSDNVTIKAPKGIAIVKIDGEKTVKAVVK
ncbi:MAG: DUF6383 domain-containing protein [Tannerella sp.]|jgi:hypothetical protein|nr:DUF6383 domain-containing protein [Tannerella sp.]